MYSFSIHISLAYVITGLIIVQYKFNLAVFDTNLLLNIYLIGILTYSVELSPS